MLQVQIGLLDRNDSPPEFSNSLYDVVQVVEDIAPGYMVLQLTATDADKNGTLSYALVSGNQQGHFTINSNSGILFFLIYYFFDHSLGSRV